MTDIEPWAETVRGSCAGLSDSINANFWQFHTTDWTMRTR